MKSNESIRVAVAETSVIIRSGLTLALKCLSNLKIQPIGLLSVGTLNDCPRTQFSDVLVVNPTFDDLFDAAHSCEETAGKEVGVTALVSSFINVSLLSKYDASTSIFDDSEVLANKIDLLQGIEPEEKEDSQEALSQHEKKAVICVVRGIINKEIAEKFSLSIHTVTIHRRDISKKLQIHNAVGLTIYAIVDKLVELDDTKDLQL